MSLLQAFSVGLPAIVTDVGGMAEVVRVTKAGLSVHLTAPVEMAAAILQLTGNSAERQALSRAGGDSFSSFFTLQTMIGKYAIYYESALKVQIWVSI